MIPIGKMKDLEGYRPGGQGGFAESELRFALSMDGCRPLATLRARRGAGTQCSSSIRFGTLLRGDLFGMFLLPPPLV